MSTVHIYIASSQSLWQRNKTVWERLIPILCPVTKGIVFAPKITTVAGAKKKSVRECVAHGTNGMHASQPRPANTQRISGCTRRHRHVRGHTFGTISLYTTLHEVRGRPCWFGVSNKNARHTSFDPRSFATLTDGSCVALCRLAGELHHKRHVTRATLDVSVHEEISISLSANLDSAGLATFRLYTGFMLRTTKCYRGYLSLINA